VYKHIIAVGALDESIPLCGVKPFHGAFFSHYLSPTLSALSLKRGQEPNTQLRRSLFDYRTHFLLKTDP
jgi:hypothetical protein